MTLHSVDGLYTALKTENCEWERFMLTSIVAVTFYLLKKYEANKAQYQCIGWVVHSCVLYTIL